MIYLMSGKESKLKVKWTGYTVQENEKREDLVIQHMISDAMGQITGFGKDQTGKFEVVGYISQKGIFTLQKLYEAKLAGPIYKGTFSNGYLSGFWAIGGNSNRFLLHMDQTKKFGGFYNKLNNTSRQIGTEMNLRIDKNGIFGIGNDHSGFFVINGEAKAKEEFKFVVSYLNQKFSLMHEGNKTVDKQKTIQLEGFWSNYQKNLRGNFRFKEKLPKRNQKGVIIAEAELAEEQPMEEILTYKKLHSSMFNQTVLTGLGILKPSHKQGQNPFNQITPLLITKPLTLDQQINQRVYSHSVVQNGGFNPFQSPPVRGYSQSIAGNIVQPPSSFNPFLSPDGSLHEKRKGEK